MSCVPLGCSIFSSILSLGLSEALAPLSSASGVNERGEGSMQGEMMEISQQKKQTKLKSKVPLFLEQHANRGRKLYRI